MASAATPPPPPTNKAKQAKQEQVPVSCPICHSSFISGTQFIRHAADKHFMEELSRDLPAQAPFRCPLCKHETKDLKLLVRHYGLNHHMVIKIMNERCGKPNCFDAAVLKQVCCWTDRKPQT